MNIDLLFMDYDQYLITVDGCPIGITPVHIGEAIVIKAWLRKNIDKLGAFFATKRGWGVMEEIEIMGETRGDT